MSAFDRGAFERLREQAGMKLGEPLSAVAETASTNDDALLAARSGAPHGATFVADHQSAGRGRRGRKWLADPGQALLVSVVLRLELEPSALGLLPLSVGLAVREAIADLLPDWIAPTTKVKWPNDVWVGGKKIAGVLAEGRLDAHHPAVVAGIGINLGAVELAPDLRGSATSFALLGVAVTRERVLAGVLSCLERRLLHLSHDRGEIASELRRHDALFGHGVNVDGTSGTAAGIDHAGRLLVKLPSGPTVEIQSGSVEIVT
jgi:BirA family biotin operon repressor/biotin-[acetyl-CoA-carboxylase] ligase